MRNILLLFLLVACQSSVSQSNDYLLDVGKFDKFRMENPKAIIIDVRTNGEVAKGVIKGATQIDYRSNDFKKKLNQLDKDKVYMVYCAVGGRSGRAASMMNQLGFKNVYDLKGGITAWKAAGKELSAYQP
ncbi:MAG: rhodanese-like domain-containing protein [Cyclobacteriaceae bacterium]